MYNLFKMDEDNRKKVTIEIENVTEAQALALEELMATWQFISDKKIFYWTAFLIDGFLDWSPKIIFNGREPQRYMEDIGLRAAKVKFEQFDGSLLDEEMYFLDYQKIQNKLNERND